MNNRFISLSYLPLFVRLLLGALFVYAGVSKAMDIPAFASQIQRFGIGNEAMSSVVARYLPFLEILCGGALLVGRFTLGAVSIYAALLMTFEGVLGYAWLTGFDGGCGCFGKLFGSGSVQSAFVRNLFLLVATALLLSRELDLWPRLRRRRIG